MKNEINWGFIVVLNTYLSSLNFQGDQSNLKKFYSNHVEVEKATLGFRLPV